MKKKKPENSFCIGRSRPIQKEFIAVCGGTNAQPKVLRIQKIKTVYSIHEIYFLSTLWSPYGMMFELLY
ncbi:hypothetical protein CL638_02055 [bacterium]|nr:hypothetical protein [bacterium]